jgi:hypothetical protein
MKVFVSYPNHNDVAVRSLADDLERARQQAWLDQDLGGGNAWWAQILEQIRACTVFVFALSNNSLYPAPCRAELEYATALGVPILPVQISEAAACLADLLAAAWLRGYPGVEPGRCAPSPVLRATRRRGADDGA